MERIFFSVMVVSLGALQVFLAWPCLRHWPDSDAVFLSAIFSGVFGAALLTSYRPLATIACSVVRCSVGVFATLLGFQFLWLVIRGASQCSAPMPVFMALGLCLSFGGPSLVVGWLVHRRWRVLRRRDVEEVQKS